MRGVKKGGVSEHKLTCFMGTHVWATVITRGSLFLFVWWALTGEEVSSWWIGVPAVVLALMVSVALVPPVYLAWRAVLRFFPFFLSRSLMGGIDVAWRAFHPRLPIAPELIEYPLQLPVGIAQVMMANTVSLLPGTLSAELNHNVLKVHVLYIRNNVKKELEIIERYIKQMFDLS